MQHILVAQQSFYPLRFGANKPPVGKTPGDKISLPVIQPHEMQANRAVTPGKHEQPVPQPKEPQPLWQRFIAWIAALARFLLYSKTKAHNTEQKVLATMDKNELELIKKRYQGMEAAHEKARKTFGKQAITLSEKLLFSHLDTEKYPEKVVRGETILSLHPDRVAMQDATAQMAILQFMQSKRKKTAVPATVHCDHLIRAQSGVKEDMERALKENAEVYNFLRSAAAKYGMGFWQPGSGIIHQVILEKHAFPGGMVIGTDSHTPNGGGLAFLAIGVGGSDAAEVMAGLPFEIRAPKLVGVKLTGELKGWTTPKDVITKIVGLLTTKGGTNKIIEYFGSGARSISATGKATITNMGAELGATTSVFPYDENMAKYLRATGRPEVAELAEAHADLLRPDPDVEANPQAYFDEVIEINLSELEPYINGPHTPDLARPLSEFAKAVEENNYPAQPSAALIGSCTNSSYQDLEAVASLARQAKSKGLKLKTPLLITPGSQQVLETIKTNGQLQELTDMGATVLANACGPCIGQWNRPDVPPGEVTSIVSTFNRNFPGRNDGRKETLSFLTSPVMTFWYALSGDFKKNPLKDTVDGVKLDEPVSVDLPPGGFTLTDEGLIQPPESGEQVTVEIKPDSSRLEILEPFAPWDGKDFSNLPVLIKTKGKTTTDDISPAGPWLSLRGHLTGISYNTLMRAVDAETGEAAKPANFNFLGQERQVSPWALKAKEYRDNPEFGGSVIVGDENYGEGSSREHAAMSPRLLGVKAVITRSFARIHETNLKKQGILPLTFSNPADYDRVQKDDRLDIVNLANLREGQPVTALVHKPDGAQLELTLNHSMTNEQIRWFKAGSAINAVSQSQPALQG